MKSEEMLMEEKESQRQRELEKKRKEEARTERRLAKIERMKKKISNPIEFQISEQNRRENQKAKNRKRNKISKACRKINRKK